jgi:hypothetical protein
LVSGWVFVDHSDAVFAFVPLESLAGGLEDPVLREWSKHTTPETATEPPHSEFVREESNVGAFGTHFYEGGSIMRLVLKVDCAPLGARAEAVDVEVVVGLQTELLRGLVEGDVGIGAEQLQSAKGVSLYELAQLRIHR